MWSGGTDVILAVDPGIRGVGAALFHETKKELVRAAYVKNADPTGSGLEEQAQMARCVLFWADAGGKEAKLDYDNGRAVLVAEMMQIYPGMGVNPNTSLLPLVGVVAHLSGMRDWGHRVAYRPREWKKTLNGDLMTKRIESRLTADELKRIEPCPPSLRHNVIDACGIGLHYLGRLERKRVVRR